jgi:hypothetical protein
MLKGEQPLIKIELGMGYNSSSIIEEGIEITFSPLTGFRDKDPGAMEAITLIQLPWVGIFKMASVFSRAFLMNKSLIYQKPVDGRRNNPLVRGYMPGQFQLPGDDSSRAGRVFFLEGDNKLSQLRRKDPALPLVGTLFGLKGLKASPAIPGHPIFQGSRSNAGPGAIGDGVGLADLFPEQSALFPGAELPAEEL